MCDCCKYCKDGSCYHPFDWQRDDDNFLGFCNLYEPDDSAAASGDDFN